MITMSYSVAWALFAGKSRAPSKYWVTRYRAPSSRLGRKYTVVESVSSALVGGINVNPSAASRPEVRAARPFGTVPFRIRMVALSSSGGGVGGGGETVVRTGEGATTDGAPVGDGDGCGVSDWTVDLGLKATTAPC